MFRTALKPLQLISAKHQPLLKKVRHKSSFVVRRFLQTTPCTTEDNLGQAHPYLERNLDEVLLHESHLEETNDKANFDSSEMVMVRAIADPNVQHFGNDGDGILCYDGKVLKVDDDDESGFEFGNDVERGTYLPGQSDHADAEIPSMYEISSS